MKILRWIITVPLAILGWALAVFIGFVLHKLFLFACPQDLMSEGICFANWFQPLSDAAFVICAALAAFLVVLLPAFTVPSYKALVAILMFIAGTASAVYMALDVGALWLLPSTIGSGMLATLLICKKLGVL